MKVLIWIHNSDVINNRITKYEYTKPYHDRSDEWVQVEITADEFTSLQDTTSYECCDEKNPCVCEPEFARRPTHISEEVIPDIIKKHKTVKGGDFPEWWASLTKEEQITITKYYE